MRNRGPLCSLHHVENHCPPPPISMCSFFLVPLFSCDLNSRSWQHQGHDSQEMHFHKKFIPWMHFESLQIFIFFDSERSKWKMMTVCFLKFFYLSIARLVKSICLPYLMCCRSSSKTFMGWCLGIVVQRVRGTSSTPIPLRSRMTGQVELA